MNKSTITRERIQRIIRAIDSEAYDEEEIREWLSSDEIMELARLALAAMDSEPVAYTDEAELNFVNDMACMWTKGMGINEVPLYRHAQPAPVVDADDNFYSWFGREWHENYQHNQYTTAAKQMLGVMAESAWKAGRRAAMLQAGALTNEDTKQTWAGIPDIDNAIIMLDRIDTQESCDDDRIEDVKAVLRRLASNSPVIPDGLIAAVNRLLDSDGSRGCYSAIQCGDAHDEIERLLAAAPQEVQGE